MLLCMGSNFRFRSLNVRFLYFDQSREFAVSRIDSANYSVTFEAMTNFLDENPHKRSIIEKGFLEDKSEFSHDLSIHFLELCDACRRGDLEAVQT